MSGESVKLEPGQLVLSRRPGEQLSIKLGDVVGTITIARVNRQSRSVRIALQFPKSVEIRRTELLQGATE